VNGQLEALCRKWREEAEAIDASTCQVEDLVARDLLYRCANEVEQAMANSHD
jgi:hypothetical protein